MVGPEDEDNEYRPLLPADDRVWRHPAEVAADLRALGPAVSVSTMRTPVRQAVALTALGAVGGALVVSGLFLTLGSAPPGAGATGPAVVNIAMDPVVPIERRVAESEWAATVVARVSPAIATIEVGDRTGSAVVIQSDGLLLTSSDLVDDAADVTVVLANGDAHPGRVLGSDQISGLSVVEIDDWDLVAAPLGIFKQPEIGDHTVVLPGASPPDDLEMGTLSATNGKIRVSSSLNLHGLLQVDVPLPDRGSGSALVDDTGAVIGIVVDVGTDNTTHAVPIGWARKIADDIIVWGEARHPWLGIRGIDPDAETRELAQVDVAVKVEFVISDGPADVAGIDRGDFITAIDGKPIESMGDLILELRRHPPGDALEIALSREGDASTRVVTLGLREDVDTE